MYRTARLRQDGTRDQTCPRAAGRAVSELSTMLGWGTWGSPPWWVPPPSSDPAAVMPPPPPPSMETEAPRKVDVTRTAPCVQRPDLPWTHLRQGAGERHSPGGAAKVGKDQMKR